MNEIMNEMMKNSGIVSQSELNESVQGKVKRHIKKLDFGKKELNKIMKGLDKRLIEDVKSGKITLNEKDIPRLVHNINISLVPIEKGLERYTKRVNKLGLESNDVKTKEDKVKVLNKFVEETKRDKTLDLLLKLLKDNKKVLGSSYIFIFLTTLSSIMILSTYFVPGIFGLTDSGITLEKSMVNTRVLTSFLNVIDNFPIVILKNYFIAIKNVKNCDEAGRLAFKIETHLEKISE